MRRQTKRERARHQEKHVGTTPKERELSKHSGGGKKALRGGPVILQTSEVLFPVIFGLLSPNQRSPDLVFSG